MTATPARNPAEPASATPSPGDTLVRVGGLVLIAGMLVTVVACLPLVSTLELPSVFWWLAILLVGSGMAMVLLGLLRKGRSRSRLQRSAQAPTRS